MYIVSSPLVCVRQARPRIVPAVRLVRDDWQLRKTAAAVALGEQMQAAAAAAAAVL